MYVFVHFIFLLVLQDTDADDEDDDDENLSLLVKGDSQGELVIVVAAAVIGNKRLPIDFPVIGGLSLNSGIGRLQTS